MKGVGLFVKQLVIVISATTFAQPYLLLHDFFVGPKPDPNFIRMHRGHIDRLPFDGIAVYMRDPQWELNVTASVMSSNPVSYEAIASVLAPLKDIGFATPKRNFGLLYAHRPADFFDDWSVPTANFANLARALKDVGLMGIFFDNEQYETWASYPEFCKYAESKTLVEYQRQARLRGKQIMEAMVKEFPEIEIIVLVGPWASDHTFYEKHLTYNNISRANPLLGPFFVGLLEGKGASATVVDGGEFYAARTAKDFSDLYQYQKHTISEDLSLPSTDSRTRASGQNGFIPPSLRKRWESVVNVATGLYDKPIPDGPTMNPDIMKDTLANALQHVDRYVWLYVESLTFLDPPGSSRVAASTGWLDAIQQGKNAGLAAIQGKSKK